MPHGHFVLLDKTGGVHDKTPVCDNLEWEGLSHLLLTFKERMIKHWESGDMREALRPCIQVIIT